MSLEFRHNVREKSGNFELSQGIWNFRHKGREFSYMSKFVFNLWLQQSLEIVVKKDKYNHQTTCTPRVYYATNMCYGIYSTRVCEWICNVQKYSVYKIMRFIILFGIIFSETYIQHCQNILHHQKNPPH